MTLKRSWGRLEHSNRSTMLILELCGMRKQGFQGVDTPITRKRTRTKTWHKKSTTCKSAHGHWGTTEGPREHKKTVPYGTKAQGANKGNHTL